MLSFLLTLCLAASLCATAFAAEKGSFDHFRPVNTYTQESFADVSGWYAPYVETAYTLDLMRGSRSSTGEFEFHPHGNITLAETVTLASRIRSIYFRDGHAFRQGSPWYQTYVDYAAAQGILPSADVYRDYNAPATRAQFAEILARALPDSAYEPINTIDNGAIPDASMEYSYALSVYKLYRAGILTGSNSLGAFLPDQAIRRSEAAAIASRVVQPRQRVSFRLYAPLYVGFAKDSGNENAVNITGLVMRTDGENCYLTMNFKSQKSRFVSISDAAEQVYILNVAEIEPGTDSCTFTFPLETLEQIYTTSADPASEKMTMEFYSSGSPDSVMDRFYIAIDQFRLYFED